MGIDPERFLNSVPHDTLCFLCSLVLEDPVEITECGHCFCCECFDQWKERPCNKGKVPCPFCGVDVCVDDEKSVRKSRLLWKLIQNLNVKCHHKNCEVVYKYGFEDLHKDKCEYQKAKQRLNEMKSKSMELERTKDHIDLLLNEQKCPTCRNYLGEDINSHDCTRQLCSKLKEQNSTITNLEHENDRLMFKLTTCEKQFISERTDIESKFYYESLRYEKDIRDLRTRLANLQGELAVINGENDMQEFMIQIQRIQGSLGFNIIGGSSSSKLDETNAGIFVSRIVEGGAADQPEKLNLHDQILEVDGVDLREATHELAVNTFRNSGDPVKMIVRRSVRKIQSGLSKIHQDLESSKFQVERCEDKIKPDDSAINNNKTSNNKSKTFRPRGWFSPEELAENRSDVSVSLTADTRYESKKNDANKCQKNNNTEKEEYDSAYDTLMTNKSSRSSIHQTTTTPGISDVESTSTEHTLAVGSSANDNESSSSDVQRACTKDFNSDLEKRHSTFFIIPTTEKNEESSLYVGDDGFTGEDEEAEFEYEYEKVVLQKCAGKFGVLLCYGGETDVAVYVGDVEENSSADMSGKIMVGDQIVKINHFHVTNVEQAYRMFEENEEITLLVARAVYEAAPDFYDEAEETDLDMLDCINEESELQFASKTSSPTYASSISSRSSDTTKQSTDKTSSTEIRRTRAKTLSPIERTDCSSPVRERSSSIDDDPRKRWQMCSDVTTTKYDSREAKKNSLKQFVRNKLSGQKDKRTGSHSDDSCDFNKLPRCDSNSSTNSNKSQKSRDNGPSKSRSHSNSGDIMQAKLKEQRQQSKMKAYMDSPSLNQYRQRVDTNVSLFQAPYMIKNGPMIMPYDYQQPHPHIQHTRPPLTPTPPMNNTMLGHRSDINASVSSLRSAMKNSHMNQGKLSKPETRVAKRVQIDPHPGWNDTEKRVWEEFKIIQSMEKESLQNNNNNSKDNNGKKEVEAEWRVRRSKDGKHVYIKKTNSTRNKILKDRAQEIANERCGITTDDDAFTVYQGQYWNREQRRRQLNRHNERRKKLLQKAEQKATYENRREKEMAEMVQRKMTLPVFDNFVTIEEILSQRNRSGVLAGPIHVTTI